MLELEECERKFKLLWVSCSSLLRAVGHALHKVDSKRNDELRKIVEEWWGTLKANREDHKIFFEFVERERNTILKEYELGFFSGEIDVLVRSTGESFRLAETAFCPMSSGAFEGEDCRDIAASAINWWEEQLCEIEQQSAP
ncbi:MAG: hypothetical protein KDC54_24240 [Lewinella sp.]|nr:hypothetical protein [Lewinella sp.]